MQRIPSLAFALLATCTAVAAAENVRFVVLNLEPQNVYTVSGGAQGPVVVNASQGGVASLTLEVNSGNLVTFSTDGAVAPPPLAPQGLAVIGGADGCAAASWNANQEADVVLYRLYHRAAGNPGAVWTDSVDVANDTSVVVCGLAASDYEFAVRAGNAAGTLSAMSKLITASVSTGDAQPPLPPRIISVKSGDPGCAVVKWQHSGDPTVVGYVVEYGELSVPSEAVSYPYSADAGNVATVDVCDLSAGDYHVVVRARNHLGILSGYSSEMTVSIIVTPVFITRFDAHNAGEGVYLTWDVSADEAVAGFRITRTIDNDPGATMVFDVPAGANHYTDADVLPEMSYTYVLTAVTASGNDFQSAPALVTTPALALALEANVPNPFNPRTAISFTLPASGRARLDIFDVAGRLVDTLIDRELPPGRHTEYWTAQTATGAPAPSGAYFYRLRTANGIVSRKMLLVK